MTLPVTVAWRMLGAAVPPAGLWNFSFPTTFSLSCRPGCLLTLEVQPLETVQDLQGTSLPRTKK